MSLLCRLSLFATVVGAALCLSAAVSAGAAQTTARDPAEPLAALAELEADGVALADDIWRFAELGYLEERSSERLQDYLAGRGFKVEAGAAGMPTAFVASRGTGKPVIGLLAEFDALPGLSQAAVPKRQPLVAGGAGHACGHHLFGAASALAAAALGDWLAARGLAGSVRIFGTPAEEGGSGKVYMARAGLFDDVDVMLHWHPADRNDASPYATTANKSGRFRFKGIGAHAATAPHRGRSALDGVEAMNYMVNLMREHMPQESRVHYVITEGGAAPNIVPDTAEVYYYVRHPQPQQVVSLFERVVKAAEGAALGTGTRVSYEVMHGNYPVLPNRTLSERVYEHMRSVPPIEYSAKERAFAETIRRTAPLLTASASLESVGLVQPFGFRQGMGSTDVGDVSWKVPTAGFYAATWVPGTPAHSWQAVAAGGMSIGHQGLIYAARVLTLTGQELFEKPALRAAAAAELKERQGESFVYEPLLGDRAPPLAYRK